jgi:uncharacterized protein with gpF-like domain
MAVLSKHIQNMYKIQLLGLIFRYTKYVQNTIIKAALLAHAAVFASVADGAGVLASVG